MKLQNISIMILVLIGLFGCGADDALFSEGDSVKSSLSGSEGIIINRKCGLEVSSGIGGDGCLYSVRFNFLQLIEFAEPSDTERYAMFTRLVRIDYMRSYELTLIAKSKAEWDRYANEKF